MPLTQDNLIVTGKHGVLDTTTPEDIDRIFTQLTGKPSVTLYFHGGLVSQSSGMAVATKLVDRFEAAGQYPVFFIYETGFLEIVSRNLPEIFAEEVFQTLLQHLLGKVVGQIRGLPGARGIAEERPDNVELQTELIKRVEGQEPFGTETIDRAKLQDANLSEEAVAFQAELASDNNLVTTLRQIADSAQPATVVAENSRGIEVRAVKSPRTLLSPEVVDELAVEDMTAQVGDRGIFTGIGFLVRAAKVLVRILTRFKAHRDHGVYPTIVEELLREFYAANIGLAIWGAIKQETSDTFETGTGDTRGGAYFLDKLETLLATPGAIRPRINLVGHSTGAVFINNLLTAVAARRKAGSIPPDFQFDHIVYLAPACTFWAFAAMREKAGGLYKDFRFFGMKDAREQADHIVPYVYMRSLLYFVSGVVERNAAGEPESDVPILGMQRFFDMDQVYTDADDVAVRTYVETTGAKIPVWSPSTAGPGCNSNSEHHGDFDDDVPTLDSVSDILKEA